MSDFDDIRSDFDDISKSADRDARGAFGLLGKAWRGAKTLATGAKNFAIGSVQDTAHNLFWEAEAAKRVVVAENRMEDTAARGLFSAGRNAVQTASRAVRKHPGATEVAADLLAGDPLSAAGVGVRRVQRQIDAHDRGIADAAIEGYEARHPQTAAVPAPIRVAAVPYASEPAGTARTPVLAGAHPNVVAHAHRHQRHHDSAENYGTTHVAFRRAREFGQNLRQTASNKIHGTLNATWQAYHDTAVKLAADRKVGLHDIAPRDVIMSLRDNAKEAFANISTAARNGVLQLGGVDSKHFAETFGASPAVSRTVMEVRLPQVHASNLS